jgi:protein-ribulosamine 3-kinase
MAAEEGIAAQLVAAGACGAVTSRGGSVWRTDRGQCFVKLGTGGADADAALLKYEAEGLARMAAAAPLLTVPKPWLAGEVGGAGFIVMDYVEMGRQQPDYLSRLGAGLAELHLAPPADPDQGFGFPMDGCCGALAQPNNPQPSSKLSWVEFWREYRLGHQLSVARQRYPEDKALQELGAQLSARLGELFSMLVVEDIKPSLLHGDLWSGNYAVDASGTPCIYDCACYYGHYEADHGINYMFGGGEAFRNSGYSSAIPPQPGWERRAALYELHHHLNHYNIFGPGYRSGAIGLIKKILDAG